MNESSYCSAWSPALGIVCVLFFGNSNRCVSVQGALEKKKQISGSHIQLLDPAGLVQDSRACQFEAAPQVTLM